MYNGIGLSTARGSGTNGHVQRNISHLKPRDPNPRSTRSQDESTRPLYKPANADILMHDKRRQVELKCLQLREMLLSSNSDADAVAEIDAKVDALRKELLAKLDDDSVDAGTISGRKAYESHHLAQLKTKENKEMARALGIDEEEHVEGDAFDVELQRRKKELRLLERERRHLEREQRRLERREMGRIQKPEKERRSPSPLRIRRSPSPLRIRRSPSPPPRRERRAPQAIGRGRERMRREVEGKEYQLPAHRLQRSRSPPPPNRNPSRRSTPSRSPSDRSRSPAYSPPPSAPSRRYRSPSRSRSPSPDFRRRRRRSRS
eukprot:Partr_v1_DN25845_c0_g1_i1_m2937 putative serine arginine repetitive matrix